MASQEETKMNIKDRDDNGATGVSAIAAMAPGYDHARPSELTRPPVSNLHEFLDSFAHTIRLYDELQMQRAQRSADTTAIDTITRHLIRPHAQLTELRSAKRARSAEPSPRVGTSAKRARRTARATIPSKRTRAPPHEHYHQQIINAAVIDFPLVTESAPQGPGNPGRIPLANEIGSYCPRYLFHSRVRPGGHPDPFFFHQCSSSEHNATEQYPHPPEGRDIERLVTDAGYTMDNSTLYSVWTSSLQRLLVFAIEADEWAVTSLAVLDTWSLHDKHGARMIMHIPEEYRSSTARHHIDYLIFGLEFHNLDIETLILQDCVELPQKRIEHDFAIGQRWKFMLARTLLTAKTFARRFRPEKRFFMTLLCIVAIYPQQGPQFTQWCIDTLPNFLTQEWHESGYIHVSNLYHFSNGIDMTVPPDVQDACQLYTTLAHHFLEQSRQADTERVQWRTYWQLPIDAGAARQI